MKEINCPLCGSFSKRLILFKNGRKISKCNKCGFVFTSTRALESDQNQIYQDRYFHIEDFENQKSQGYRSYFKDREYHRYYFGRKINLIQKYKDNGKVLDVGCALGFFMETAKENGFDPYGIDVSKYAISYANKNFPGKVFCTTIDESKFKRQSFDVVTLFQTIEHLDNPLKLLNEVHALLKKGGLVVVACPNYDSFIRKALGKNWFEYKPEEHLNYFDLKSINKILNKSGFKIKYFGRDVFYYSLSYILERLSYYSVNSTINKLFKYIYRATEKKIIKDFKIPLPLGGMIVIAVKK